MRSKGSGREGHGGYLWRAVDPITPGAQIVLGLQTVVSRRTDLMKSPVVVSVAAFNGGNRNNVIPDSVEMLGTVRTYDPDVRVGVVGDIEQIAKGIAEGANAKSEIEFGKR